MSIAEMEAAAAAECDAIAQRITQAETAWRNARARDGSKAVELDGMWRQLLARWQDMNTACADCAANAQRAVAARTTMRSTLEAAIRDFDAVPISDVGRPRHVNPMLLGARLQGDFSPARMAMEAADAAAEPVPIVPLDPQHPAARAAARTFVPHEPRQRHPGQRAGRAI